MLSMCRNKTTKANGKRVLEVFNGTVYVEFRVYFAMAMYENDMFLLCEISNAFIGAFSYSKSHFYPSGSFKSIKTMLKSLHVLLGLSPVWNCYPKGCLSFIWYTVKIPVAWTYPAREHYKNTNFL